MEKLKHHFRHRFQGANYLYYKFKSEWYEANNPELEDLANQAYEKNYTQSLMARINRKHPTKSVIIGDTYKKFIAETYYPGYDGGLVEFSGINNRLNDMGRDLIIVKGNECVIVQCKRWAQPKAVHEKHIFQLFGTTYLYQQEHPDLIVKAAFYTSAKLSDEAKKVADKLSIEYHEQIKPER